MMTNVIKAKLIDIECQNDRNLMRVFADRYLEDEPKRMQKGSHMMSHNYSVFSVKIINADSS